MRLFLEACFAFGKNLVLALYEKLANLWSFLHLRDFFRWFGRVLGLPYECFRRLSEDGRVNISKYARGQNSFFLYILIELVFFPYHCFLQSTERMGESEFESSVLKFWFTFGWLLLLLLPLVVIYLVRYHET